MSRRSHTVATALAVVMLSQGVATSQTAPQVPQDVPPPQAQPSPFPAPAATPAPAADTASPATDAAARDECAWSGKRVITLLWRDDINGAREQLRFYDRFLCPDTRLRDAFRCVIRSGEFDADKPESVASKVEQCWTAPERQPQEPPVPEKPAAQ